MTPLEQRRVCIAPSSTESPRRPLRAPPRRSRERSGARPIYRGAERPRGRSNDSRWMRPIDFCRPTPSRHPTDCSILPCGRRTRLTPRRSLRSSPCFTAISPALSSRTGVERSAVRVRFPGARPESVETERLLMDKLPRLPFGGAAFRVGACSAPCAFGGDASGTLVTRASVAGRPRL